jgi:hypothetical protein
MAAADSVPPPTVPHAALRRMVFGEVDHSRFVKSPVSLRGAVEGLAADRAARRPTTPS